MTERLKSLKKKPKKIVKLSSGAYYYNYDILVEEVASPNEGEGTVKEYSYVQVKCWGAPSYKNCIAAVIRAYVSESDELDLINTYASADMDIAEESEEYEEYLKLVDEIKYNVKQDFGVGDTRDEVEEALKRIIRKITKYDESDAVNSFYLNGNAVWLDKSTRVGLMNSLTVEKNAGKEESTLWFDTLELTINIDLAISLLSQLELYALDCYNVTAAHKNAVYLLTTVADVNAYDYTVGYPDKLEFTLE